MNMPHHPPGTVDKVISMWKDHKTGGDIAYELGMTRSAVMGLVGRLRKKGLLDYRDPGAKKNATPNEKRQKLRNPFTPNLRKTKLPPLPPVPETASPLKLFDLKPSSCRFVINDSKKAADFLFCGRDKEIGAYCKDHHALCYVKVEPRKRDKPKKPFQLNPRYAEAK